ncbi:tetratricopeptide repeat protein [Roseateles sp.]|jgi:tetratricopeptide (TPR) repeat protein|uniref:tetratricopeptide repeat protein n=1 Tax=Roseateles sp. TaxID=1971397 RepID=UPI003919A15A
MKTPTAALTEPLRIAGAGTEYQLCLPHLLPRAMEAEAMLSHARELLARYPEANTSPQSARERSSAAFMLLCVGQEEEAELLLREAIQAQHLFGDTRSLTSSALRLVQVLQQLDRPREAVAVAREALARLDPESPARHFALHHLGKALAHCGDANEAQKVLQEARRLREALDAPELLASTKLALALLPSS